MEGQRKKCAVEGCGKPAVGRVPTTIVENNKIMSGYMYYCEDHFNPVIKEVLTLRSKKGEVDFTTSKDGKIGLTVRNSRQLLLFLLTLSNKEAKAVIEFLKKYVA